MGVWMTASNFRVPFSIVWYFPASEASSLEIIFVLLYRILEQGKRAQIKSI